MSNRGYYGIFGTRRAPRRERGRGRGRGGRQGGYDSRRQEGYSQRRGGYNSVYQQGNRQKQRGGYGSTRGQRQRKNQIYDDDRSSNSRSRGQRGNRSQYIRNNRSPRGNRGNQWSRGNRSQNNRGNRSQWSRGSRSQNNRGNRPQNRRGQWGGQKQKDLKRKQPTSNREKPAPKRQRVIKKSPPIKKQKKSNTCALPLSLILIAKQGDKTGTAPELVFSRFYNCSHEVLFGREKHKLQLIAKQDINGKSETVSLPVPYESINGVAALTGMNEYEKLLTAYDDRADLRNSIEHLIEVLGKREAVFLEKSAELESMSEVEDEEEVEETKESDKQKEEEAEDDEDLNMENEPENQEEESEHTEVDAQKEESEDPEVNAQKEESEDPEVNAQKEESEDPEIDADKEESEDPEVDSLEKESEDPEVESQEKASEDAELEEKENVKDSDVEDNVSLKESDVDEEAKEKDDEAQKEDTEAQKKEEEAKEEAEAAKLEEQQRKAEEAKKKSEAAELEKQKKAELEKQRKKEKKLREMKRQKRALFEAKVEKLKVAFEKAKKNLAEEQEKLGQIEKDFGEQLSYLESDSADGVEVFLRELMEGKKVVEDTGDVVEEVGSTLEDDGSTLEADPNPECEDEKREDAENVKETEAVDISKSCCEEAIIAGEKFCSGCGKATGTVQVETTEKVTKEKKPEKITETPVYLFFTIKEPLIKFYASNVETILCEKDSLKHVSMIIIGYNPTLSSAEHLKTLNEAMDGPWKDIRRRPELLINEESPFTLGKTLTYLAKMFKRQDISDNTLDICELCGAEIKRMAMKKHVNEQCQMRDVPCQYCGDIFIAKDLKEHHETDCPMYPIRCPQKCNSAKIPRSKMDDHFKTCPNTIVICEFKYLGCDVELKRHQVPAHMKNAGVEHVRLLHRQLTKVSSYLLSQDAALGDVFNPAPPAEAIAEE